MCVIGLLDVIQDWTIPGPLRGVIFLLTLVCLGTVILALDTGQLIIVRG